MKKLFGIRSDGREAYSYTITGGGLTAEISDHGATILRLWVPDKKGNLADVILGFDTPDAYDASDTHTGAVVGRSCNRTRRGQFTLNGKTYQLDINNGNNSLHGGFNPYKNRLWTLVRLEENCIAFSLHSPDGDQGFPGTLEVQVTYCFSKDNELLIHYEAVTDKTTIINMTNHAYFNLDGHDAGDVCGLEMQINAPYVNEVREGLIPTGKLVPVGETAYDFSTMRNVGEVLAKTESDPVMAPAGGVDFNYCAGRDRETKIIATLYSPKTGRVMDVITDQPGVQCYTGQGLNVTGKDGVHYGAYAGMCLETQHYPDAIHHPEFATIVLRPQDTYDTFTIYAFSVK